MYYFECPHCHYRHGIAPSDLSRPSSAVHRTCHDCGQDGCVDCLPDEMEVPLCSACFDRRNGDDGEDVDQWGEQSYHRADEEDAA